MSSLIRSRSLSKKTTFSLEAAILSCPKDFLSEDCMITFALTFETGFILSRYASIISKSRWQISQMKR